MGVCQTFQVTILGCRDTCLFVPGTFMLVSVCQAFDVTALGSELASLPEGSEAGLQRLTRGEVMAAAIHMHRLSGDPETANIDAVVAQGYEAGGHRGIFDPQLPDEQLGMSALTAANSASVRSTMRLRSRQTWRRRSRMPTRDHDSCAARAEASSLTKWDISSGYRGRGSGVRSR